MPYQQIHTRDEEQPLDESSTDDEQEEEWQQAARLANQTLATRPRRKSRALAGDGSTIQMEQESLGSSAIVSGVFLLLIFCLSGLANIFLLMSVLGLSAKPEASSTTGLFLYVFAFMFYMMYLFESLVIDDRPSLYLRNICGEASFRQFLNTLKESPPIITFSIQNWHNEERTEKTKDEEGKEVTITKIVQVTTHSADMTYDIRGQVDETLSPDQMLAMFHLVNGDGAISEDAKGDIHYTDKGSGEQVMILLCSFPMEFHPHSPGTLHHHNATRDAFWAANIRDTHQSTSVTEEIHMKGYVEHMMVILSTNGDDSTNRPWWMTYSKYVLCSVLCLSVVYRFYLFRGTGARTWQVTKHFSSDPGDTSTEPMKSVKKSDNQILAWVAKLGNKFDLNKARREEAGDNGDADEYEELCDHQQVEGELHVDEQPPEYWDNTDARQHFDAKPAAGKEEKRNISKLIEETFIDVATRDRRGEMPSALKVVAVHRVEDRNMWVRYAEKRNQIAEQRDGSFTPIKDLKNTSGPVKTMKSMNTDIHEGINEAYLFHGTSPDAAMKIGEDGFKVSMAGSNVGTMFGRGAYFAEACSKCDEYAQTDDSGLYTGLYGMLLCRVVLGETFRVSKSNIPAIEKALASGEYDSVLGDREASVGTFREFVVFDEAQIYPEYIVIYSRV